MTNLSTDKIFLSSDVNISDWLFLFINILIGVNVALLAANIFFGLNGLRRRVIDKEHIHLLCIIGSGGHTTEMMKLLSGIGERYSKRTYVIANTDKMGEKKVLEFEENRRRKLLDGRSNEIAEDGDGTDDKFQIKFIPRSREVKQSYVSAIRTTLVAGLHSVRIVYESSPDVFLCNGPGTGLPICMIAALLNLFRIFESKVIFVESICRVKTLSLTGRILYISRLTNCFLVQWPELQERYPRTKYIGRLV